jgi:hypothetical protein
MYIHIHRRSLDILTKCGRSSVNRLYSPFFATNHCPPGAPRAGRLIRRTRQRSRGRHIPAGSHGHHIPAAIKTTRNGSRRHPVGDQENTHSFRRRFQHVDVAQRSRRTRPSQRTFGEHCCRPRTQKAVVALSGYRRVSLQVHSVRTSRPLVKVVFFFSASVVLPLAAGARRQASR